VFMVRLSRSELHSSVDDPVLGSMSFLNGIMSRYPDAISFAPGAPYSGFFADLDVQRYTDRYLDYLVDVEQHTAAKARRMLYEYGPSRGLINGIVCEALRRGDGITASPSATVITAGAQEALFLALRVLFPTGGQNVLAVTNPCYMGIVGAARILDIPIVPVAEVADGIDVDSLEASCIAARDRGQRIRACYVATDFANPGGSRMSRTGRQRLLDLAARADFLILEDSPYGFTVAEGDELPSLKALDTAGRVIHIGTFAKVCFPGARVGYVIAEQPVGDGGRTLADEIAALKSMVTVNTSPLGQAAVGGFLLEHGGALADANRRKADHYRRSLTCLIDALDRHLGTGGQSPVSWNRPVGGFFVRMQIPVVADLALLDISAAKYGVLWTPMSLFYLDGSGDCQIRLSCSYIDTTQIESGVERLAAFLKKEIGL
jgi:(S)-3,5-dihydroxyphenylglycine transaminase